MGVDDGLFIILIAVMASQIYAKTPNYTDYYVDYNLNKVVFKKPTVNHILKEETFHASLLKIRNKI